MRGLFIFVIGVAIGFVFAKNSYSYEFKNFCKNSGDGLFFSKYGFMITCNDFTRNVVNKKAFLR